MRFLEDLGVLKSLRLRYTDRCVAQEEGSLLLLGERHQATGSPRVCGGDVWLQDHACSGQVVVDSWYCLATCAI